MFWPCETRTSTCRNFATISSGLYRFLVITVLLDVKDIPQVGPLQWGRIRLTPRRLSLFHHTQGRATCPPPVADDIPHRRAIDARACRALAAPRVARSMLPMGQR